MENCIREIDSEIPIIWIDASQEPEKVKERNIMDCIVNARRIKSFVLDKEGFQNEVRGAI